MSEPDQFDQDAARFAAAMAALFDRANESEPDVDELRERISTLEALTDQLAEAFAVEHDPDECYPDDCPRCAARRAYVADKEAHR